VLCILLLMLYWFLLVFIFEDFVVWLFDKCYVFGLVVLLLVNGVWLFIEVVWVYL